MTVPSNLTITAQADVTRMRETGRVFQPTPAWVQLAGTVEQIVRDPVGTVVGIVKGVSHDLHTALFSITPEELANPQIRQRLISLGVDPDRLKPTATANEVMLAGGRTAALVAGTAAGAGVGAVLGPTASLGGAAVKGAAEAIAFGTVGGALTPVEEGQTRAGNMLTWSAIGVPMGAAGGVTSYAISKALRAHGIKPELEAPEASVVPPEFDATAAARAPRPQNLPRDTDVATFFRRGGTVEGQPSGGLMRVGGRPSPPPRPGIPATMESPTFLRRREGVEVPPEGPPLPPRQPPDVARDAVLGALSIGEKAKGRPPTADALYTMFLDDLHPINQATKDLLRLQGELGPSTSVVPYGTTLPGTPSRLHATSLTPGVRLSGLDDPYVLGRLTRGSAGKATQFLESGPLDWKTLQPTGPGLRQILEPVMGDAAALEQLRAFLVSPRALQLADRGIATPIPLEAARRVVETTPDAIVQVALNIYKYNDQLLQYVAGAGLLSAESVKAMRDANIHYVPFFRFMDEVVVGPTSGQTLANVASGIKPIRGGPGKIVDPLENIVKNTYALVNIADRHAVADALVRLVETVPDQQIVRRVPQAPTARGTAIELRKQLAEAGVEVPPEVAQNMADAFRAPKEGTVWVIRNGERQYFEVDPPLYRALLQLDRESQNTLIKVLSVPASIQRAGFTTFNPSFAIRNPLRDQFSAAVFSRFGFKPGYDLLRGIFHVFDRDGLYAQFQRSGGEHAVISRSVSMDRVRTQRTVDHLLRSDSRLAWAYRNAKTPRGWLEMAARFSEMMEEATRTQEFARALAATGDQRLAGFAARDVTIDFQRMGTAIRVANQVVPFMNAAMQDVDKVARTFGAEGGRRAAQATALGLATITMPTIALYLLNRDDPNYHELSSARRDLFWNIPRFRFNDEQGRAERVGFISIPIPFLQGVLFKTVPERTMLWLDQKDREPFDGMAQRMLDVATPPLVPGAILPPLQVIANYDFFRDRPIIPESEQRLLAQEQAGPLQGETVRLIARALDTSPRNVEHLITQYTGGLGELGLSATDAALRVVGIERPGGLPERGVQGVPVLGKILQSFLVNEPTINSRSVERFYERYEEVTAVMATFRGVAQQGRSDDVRGIADAYKTEIVMYRTYIQTADAIARLRDAVNRVRANKNVTFEEREQQILLLGRTIRTLAGNANTAYLRVQDQFESVPADLRVPVGETRVPLPRP